MVPKVFINCNPSRNPISQHFTSPLYQFETHPSDSNIYFLPLSNEPIKSVNSCLCSCCLPSFSLFNFSLKRCLFVIVPYAQMFQNVLLPTSTGSHLFCANSQGLLFLSLGYYKLKPPSLLPNIIFKLNRFLLTLYLSYSSYCIEVLHLKFPFLVLTFLHNHFYVIWLLNCYQVYAIQLNSTLIPAFEKTLPCQEFVFNAKSTPTLSKLSLTLTFIISCFVKTIKLDIMSSFQLLQSHFHFFSSIRMD